MDRANERSVDSMEEQNELLEKLIRRVDYLSDEVRALAATVDALHRTVNHHNDDIFSLWEKIGGLRRELQRLLKQSRPR